MSVGSLCGVMERRPTFFRIPNDKHPSECIHGMTISQLLSWFVDKVVAKLANSLRCCSQVEVLR
ncbi:hypothetical protein Phum_PHUM033580 [Pediculus humanus corporis]|uniref:Uncharacterized protein n=1 Tax=Pediculus humanus subsp. corporis TaxID=121224 RepID=E0VAA8_PEDHC|nr:uncharacterized protein Phum_PHUM033580 [Pediculus humanus corporis]EEB10314.1 hypothetical protein Phum_PHUM033580 [Pediculus humanus corporis]